MNRLQELLKTYEGRYKPTGIEISGFSGKSKTKKNESIYSSGEKFTRFNTTEQFRPNTTYLTRQSKWETYTLPQLKEFTKRFGFSFPSNVSKSTLVNLLNSKV